MSYYHVPTSTERNPGRLETKLSDGRKLGPPETGWSPELAALCGFVVVEETARPADTGSDTFDRTLTFPGGVPTVTWVQRPKTGAELAAEQSQANRSTIEQAVAQAIQDLAPIIDAAGNFSAAQATRAIQLIASIQRRQLRYMFNQLDATD